MNDIAVDPNLASPVTMALSVRAHACPERLNWIAEHGFAAEYAPDPHRFDRLAADLDPHLAAGVPVRYHGFFPEYEIGHQDAAVAERALAIHTAALEAMHGRGQPVITVHVGLDRTAPLDHGRVVENLARTVQRGHELGITVCLENLRRGPTSHPGLLLAWAEASGAMITLDIGHALSSQHVQSGGPVLSKAEGLTALEFIDACGGRIREAHMYEREADRHYPPQDMILLAPIVDRLLEIGCGWWTIELDDYAEALSTRALLLAYLVVR
ncbi:sugar phosphate isomerase/epimerase family protein [Chloroflexota bacterium]